MRFLVVATIAALAFLAPSEAVSVSDKLRSLSTRIAGEAAAASSSLSEAAALYDEGDADLLQINSADDDDDDTDLLQISSADDDDDTDLLQINSADDDDDTDLLQIYSGDDDDDADLLQIYSNSAASSDSSAKPKPSLCHAYADIANCKHHPGCVWSHILRVKQGNTIKTLKDPHGHCAPRRHSKHKKATGKGKGHKKGKTVKRGGAKPVKHAGAKPVKQ